MRTRGSKGQVTEHAQRRHSLRNCHSAAGPTWHLIPLFPKQGGPAPDAVLRRSQARLRGSRQCADVVLGAVVVGRDGRLLVAFDDRLYAFVVGSLIGVYDYRTSKGWARSSCYLLFCSIPSLSASCHLSAESNIVNTINMGSAQRYELPFKVSTECTCMRFSIADT